MSAPQTTHPTEDLLLEYAAEGMHPEIADHIAVCSECSDYVNDIKIIRTSIESIEEEDPPVQVRMRLEKSLQRHSGAGLLGRMLDFRNINPILLAMLVTGFILAIVLLYLHLQ